MKTTIKSWIARLLAVLVLSSSAFAQDRVPFRQEELDQMLAPIALYPDPLLSQILMASTYPLEVVQASRWSRANPGLRGQDAVRAVERMDWDPSVKSLTAFPQVLAMMDEKIDWTERLGEAFLAQQADVMDSVQGLRRRAEAAGNLLSSDQMRVSRQGELIYIAPPAPEVVYVPYYNPTVVYGPWWYPAYPPVYWAPPAYVVPAYRPGFFWGPGIAITAGFFFGHADWHHRRVNVVNNVQVTNVTVNRTMVINNRPPHQAAWQHDPAHRRGVPFRNEAARERFEHARLSAEPRREAGSALPDNRRAGDRVDNSRTVEMRQHRMDERRNGESTRRDAGADRPASGAAAPVARSVSPAPVNAARPEPQQRQPEARAPAPAQAADRRPGQGEVARPQPRGPEQRPNIVGPAPRLTVTPAESRPAPQRSGGFRPEARAAGDGGRASRPEQARSRDAAPVPRPQAGMNRPAPRAESAPQRGSQRNFGNPREQSANRGGDRKS